MKTTVVRSRIDPKIKDEAKDILKKMELSLSDGIRLFLHQVIAENALPFQVKIPNHETQKVINEINQNKGLESVTLDQLQKEWDEV